MTFSLVLDPALAERYAAARAALPITLAGGPELRVLDGAADGWVAELGGDAAGYLVSDPDPIAAASLEIETGAAVVLDLPWAGSPVGRAVPDLERPAPGLVDLTFVLGADDPRSLAAAAVDLLTVAVRLLDADPVLTTWIETPSGLSAIGDLGGATLHLGGVRSAVESGSGRVVAREATRALDLRFPAPGAAWPGSITDTTPEGERILPTVSSDARRSSLVALAHAVTEGIRPRELDDFLRAARAVVAVSTEVRS